MTKWMPYLTIAGAWALAVQLVVALAFYVVTRVGKRVLPTAKWAHREAWPMAQPVAAKITRWTYRNAWPAARRVARIRWNSWPRRTRQTVSWPATHVHTLNLQTGDLTRRTVDGPAPVPVPVLVS